MVEGSEIAIFLREEKNGEIRVSLRSRGRANVASVAAEFGGGGHVPAAGCTLFGPLPEAVNAVVAAAVRQSDLAFGSNG
jgi:phosphoesterase RecJ-like protein